MQMVFQDPYSSLNPRMTGNPLRFGATPSELAHTAPEPGEHTLDILRELGMNDDEVASLIERKIVA
jgi:crotonobetainyl-CoA:carnitine CoA-transferase CaiB-like acyl-CoA transferase